MDWVLFTWEIQRKSRRRRWFYVQLRRTLRELSRKDWRKVGGSVYVIDKKHSCELRELLRRFDGPELEWQEFKVKSVKFPSKLSPPCPRSP